MELALSPIQDRAMKLLGSGLAQETVALTLGVSPSYISQLMAQEEFAAQVLELRFLSLQKHNERDSALDSLEDSLIEKLRSSLAFCVRPMEIVKAFQVINGAKRRGASAPEQISHQNNIVTVILPTQVIQKITVNAQNQAIRAGEQELITMQSGTLLREVKGEQNAPTLEIRTQGT